MRALLVICFGLTADSMEAERAQLIAIILNVVATMHHIFLCIHNIRSIDERLEQELESNRRNNAEERRRELLRYRRKSVFAV